MPDTTSMPDTTQPGSVVIPIFFITSGIIMITTCPNGYDNNNNNNNKSDFHMFILVPKSTPPHPPRVTKQGEVGLIVYFMAVAREARRSHCSNGASATTPPTVKYKSAPQESTHAQSGSPRGIFVKVFLVPSVTADEEEPTKTDGETQAVSLARTITTSRRHPQREPQQLSPQSASPLEDMKQGKGVGIVHVLADLLF